MGRTGLAVYKDDPATAADDSSDRNELPVRRPRRSEARSPGCDQRDPELPWIVADERAFPRPVGLGHDEVERDGWRSTGPNERHPPAVGRPRNRAARVPNDHAGCAAEKGTRQTSAVPPAAARRR